MSWMICVSCANRVIWDKLGDLSELVELGGLDELGESGELSELGELEEVDVS